MSAAAALRSIGVRILTRFPTPRRLAPPRLVGRGPLTDSGFRAHATGAGYPRNDEVGGMTVNTEIAVLHYRAQIIHNQFIDLEVLSQLAHRSGNGRVPRGSQRPFRAGLV